MQTKEIDFDVAVTEFMHLLNLPFLNKQRTIDLEEKCQEAGWTVEQIHRAKIEASKKSNWSKDSFLRNNLQRKGVKVNKMSSFRTT